MLLIPYSVGTWANTALDLQHTGFQELTSQVAFLSTGNTHGWVMDLIVTYVDTHLDPFGPRGGYSSDIRQAFLDRAHGKYT